MFSLRITPSEIDSSANPQSFLLLFKVLIRQYDIQEYATGWEILNKYGEPTKPHYHFNFLADAKKETIGAYIRRWPPHVIRGNNMFALCKYSTIEDYKRWFRYVAKEKLILKMCKGFTTEEWEQMQLVAKDERKRSIKYNLEKREYVLKKSTLYDRYKKQLKGTSYREIWLEFLNLYIKDKKIINPATIRGYTNLYMLEKKYISSLEFFLMHNPQHDA